mmetsp:Transcript_8798/g.21405  ORF Transcript_8798/g.21405 Transcript_8798/m.21405 type:complete len:235 (+) Transcript_8798:1050-1754(+)
MLPPLVRAVSLPRFRSCRPRAVCPVRQPGSGTLREAASLPSSRAGLGGSPPRDGGRPGERPPSIGARRAPPFAAECAPSDEGMFSPPRTRCVRPSPPTRLSPSSPSPEWHSLHPAVALPLFSSTPHPPPSRPFASAPRRGISSCFRTPPPPSNRCASVVRPLLSGATAASFSASRCLSRSRRRPVLSARSRRSADQLSVGVFSTARGSVSGTPRGSAKTAERERAAASATRRAR